VENSRKDEAKRQAPPISTANFLAPPQGPPIKFGTYKPPEVKIELIVDGEQYFVPMKSADIDTLLIRVLQTKESETGQVEFEDKKYECDYEVFRRFLFFFYGASLRIKGKTKSK